MRARVTAAAIAATLVAGMALSGCGGADGTPVSTTKDGLAVYDPDHNVVNIAPGPRFLIQMPAPEAGSEWRLFSTPDDMGGVSLKGMASADGGGQWTFETIGAGNGTLEFQKIPVGSGEPSDSVTYEVNVK